MNELTDKLGFYFLVFQRASVNSTLLRCYIDGNDKAVYYKDEELLNFCNQAGFDKEVEMKLKDAFSTASMFLWDVENRKVKRLSPMTDLQSANKELFDYRNSIGKNPSEITVENPYKDFVDFDKNGVFKFKL